MIKNISFSGTYYKLILLKLEFLCNVPLALVSEFPFKKILDKVLENAVTINTCVIYLAATPSLIPNGPMSSSSSSARPRSRSIFHRLLARGAEPSESLSFSLCSLSLITATMDDARLIYAFYALWKADQLSSLAFVVDNLVTIIWTIQCLIVHCILMVMCYQKRFAELYDAWEDLRFTYPDCSNHKRVFDFNFKFRQKQKLLIIAGKLFQWIRQIKLENVFVWTFKFINLRLIHTICITTISFNFIMELK